MRLSDLPYVMRHDRWLLLAVLVAAAAVTALLLYDGGSGESSARQREVRTTAPPAARHASDIPSHLPPVRLRSFDPNTADSMTLLTLGLRPWQVRSLLRYRRAGGVFSYPEDFARLYGLTAGKYRELRPYIRIGRDYRPAAEVYARRERHYDARHYDARQRDTAAHAAYPAKIRAGETVDLATSDTTTLCRVPGIGPFFARRIVRYRERLGGFTSKRQLLEIDGFPESAMPFLALPHPAAVRKLNINRATAEQLRSHPYIDYHMARQVTEYRRLRGAIRDLSDLRLLPLFTPPVIERLRPYIEY